MHYHRSFKQKFFCKKCNAAGIFKTAHDVGYDVKLGFFFECPECGARNYFNKTNPSD